MAWNKVDLGVWKPENANDAVEGSFIKAEANVGQNKSILYHIEVDGSPLAVWGSTVLDIKMSVVKPGDKIKIVYLGKGTGKGGKSAPKLFDVFIDRS